MEGDTLKRSDGQIYYHTTGSGEPVVFIHGFSLDRTMWQKQVAFFRNKYQVITYDVRGFGKSSLPNGSYSHADDLQALLQRLDIQKAHLVGLSMGGRIAINFALDYPDKVISLTLIDAALEGYAGTIDRRIHSKKRDLQKAKENWLSHQLFAHSQKKPEVAKQLYRMVEQYSGWHWFHIDSQIKNKLAAIHRLHIISHPTMALVGEHDLTDFQSISTILASKIPNAQKRTILEAGHMANMEKPDEVNQHIAAFLDKNQ